MVAFKRTQSRRHSCSPSPAARSCSASPLLPAVHATAAFAVDALPDARFVGFAQQFNDFEIASGRLALAKSTNENIRGFAARMVADHTEAAQFLSRSRSEAGVSYAPDPSNTPGMVGHAAAPERAGRRRVRHRLCQRPARRAHRCQCRSTAPTRRTAATARCAAMPRCQLPKIQQNLTGARQLAGGR